MQKTIRRRQRKGLREVLAAFQQEPPVLTPSQLKRFHTRLRDQHVIAQRSTFPDLVRDLQESAHLHEIHLAPEHSEYKPFTRYVRGEISPFLLGQSLKSGSYLSHGTAVYLHALTMQLPKTVYVNKEQSMKPELNIQLAQGAIDRAFANNQRSSRYIFSWNDYRFVLLSGKNTGQFEVAPLTDPHGTEVRVTSLERTLVDIAVRPAYAGGPYAVLEAYQAALGRASINTILAVLRRLHHAYPYHQAIGFYLDRAGFPAERTERLRKLGLQYDFYLANKMEDTDYISSWRLYVPKGL